MTDAAKRQWVLSADADIIERCRARARELGVPMSRYVCAVLRAWLDDDDLASAQPSEVE